MGKIYNACLRSNYANARIRATPSFLPISLGRLLEAFKWKENGILFHFYDASQTVIKFLLAYFCREDFQSTI